MEDESNTTIRKAQFLEALEDFRGMVSPAASKVGISRQTFYNWEKVDPEFRRRVRDVRRHIPQMMEDRLVALGYEGSVKAVIYYLERNHRRYMKRKMTETVAHVHHHVERGSSSEKRQEKTFEDYLYQDAAVRHRLTKEGKTEELAKYDSVPFAERFDAMRRGDGEDVA